MRETRAEIEERLNQLDPEIELVAVEQAGSDTLRLFIDHPGGVDLALCEKATHALGELLSRYSLEVSSPGADRPLTRPEHFRRFAGRRAKVRTTFEIQGRTGFTGEIRDATESEVELEAPEGPVTIPIEAIKRSNLIPEAA